MPTNKSIQHKFTPAKLLSAPHHFSMSYYCGGFTKSTAPNPVNHLTSILFDDNLRYGGYSNFESPRAAADSPERPVIPVPAADFQRGQGIPVPADKPIRYELGGWIVSGAGKRLFARVQGSHQRGDSTPPDQVGNRASQPRAS